MARSMPERHINSSWHTHSWVAWRITAWTRTKDHAVPCPPSAASSHTPFIALLLTLLYLSLTFSSFYYILTAISSPSPRHIILSRYYYHSSLFLHSLSLFFWSSLHSTLSLIITVIISQDKRCIQSFNWETWRKQPLGRSNRKWGNNIKLDLRELG